ncbi:penicillin acylase family protein [Cellulomonas carbonis]|uniref:Penicillin amidase n=1 Tax=Cellulomonas carbonis T26 TaxID=947969 RepID=A0A0A0BLK7_9CELL|nr:penicillin acylase family protein [Cellulomonas carbonis]KGM08841.1 penicillin amidase [Cellulomonas carbonis T26]
MHRRRPLRSALVGVAAVLVVLLVAAVALVGTVVRRPLPDHGGTATLDGLEGEVTVLRDARGVPQLYADTAEDLFRAQGYVHAQDRFFEMDLRRHTTAGRLAELVGGDEAAIEADAVIRTFGWRDVAEQEWELLDPQARAWLQAYADGVNAYVHGRAVESLGVEYTLLGLRVDVPAPEPWDPVDSLAWLKAMAWDLRGNYDEELGRAVVHATVRDVARVEELFPRFPDRERAPILGGVPEPASAAVAPALPGTGPDDASGAGAAHLLGEDLEDALERTRVALEAVPHLLGEGEGIGSNSWVVSGEHTASGLPVLANDPHLSISAPGIFTQVGLHCRSVGPECPFDVAGYSFAGFPGVVIGHNADLAWGLTNLGADVTDFFLERTDAEEGTYERDGEQLPLRVRTEVIEVNGGEPVEIEVRSTEHGPIVSDVLDVGGVRSTPTAQGARRSTTEVSLAWTALEPGRTAEAVFALNTAATPEDVAAAAALFEVPSQNIVFATTDGRIGYQAPGRIPLRARVPESPVPTDGTWPRPGWDSRYDWQGWVPAAEMPAVVDPAEGFLVAANQAVTPAGAGPFLAHDWDMGYRSQRIRTLLQEAIAAGEPIDVAATQRMQTDDWSPYAEALVPSLLAAPVGDDFTREGVELLAEWEYDQEPDSPAAAYFAAVWATLLELTFWDDLPESQWPSGDSRWLAVVEGLLEAPSSPWWDDRRTVNVVESRDEILARSLETARLELTVELGKDADDWSWGRLHTAAPEHLIGGESAPALVRRLVNPAPLGVPGGSSIVNATGWDAASGSFAVTTGPAMRMVVDLGDLDASTWVNQTGSSAHPGSVHYTDQFRAWAEGEYFPWPFTRAAVEEAATRELTLRPLS